MVKDEAEGEAERAGNVKKAQIRHIPPIYQLTINARDGIQYKGKESGQHAAPHNKE